MFSSVQLMFCEQTLIVAGRSGHRSRCGDGKSSPRRTLTTGHTPHAATYDLDSITRNDGIGGPRDYVHSTP